MISQKLAVPENMGCYFQATPLLDLNYASLTGLVNDRGWASLSEYERIAPIYDFVQNEIAFGYNEADDIPASRVYEDARRLSKLEQ